MSIATRSPAKHSNHIRHSKNDHAARIIAYVIVGVFGLICLYPLLLTLPVLYLCVRLLPFALTTKLVVTLTIIVPVGGFALIGISDDSLTRWLAGWLRWRRQRRVMYYRGEANRK